MTMDEDEKPLSPAERKRVREMLERDSARRIGMLYFRNFSDFITKAAGLVGIGYLMWNKLIEKVIAEVVK